MYIISKEGVNTFFLSRGGFPWLCWFELTDCWLVATSTARTLFFFLPFFMNRRLSSGSVSLGRRSLGDEEAEDVSESRDGGPQRVQHGPSRRGRWGCALFHFPSWGLFLIWPANVTFTAHFNNPVPLLFAPSTASCEHQKHHFSALELFIAVQYKSVY